MKWLPDSTKYRDACLRLSRDLSAFKRDADYIYYVCNDCRPAHYVDAFDAVVTGDYIGKNDLIGSPMLHNGKSAGTLRYMKVVEDLSRWYYDSVIEIGGGYGGQCLVMQEMHPVYYRIIDIPEALRLTAEYLKANDIGWMGLTPNNVRPMNADILLSDFCLSELDNAGVDFYLKNITTKYLYVTCNATGARRQSLVDKLGERYKLDIQPEHPKTSSTHDNIIIYGVAYPHM